jgi:sirohydrochlorin cobaltochelatase
MKKGIMIVSFGTTHSDTRKMTIEKIEQKIKSIYSENFCIKSAYTSSIVRKNIFKNEKINMLSPEEAVNQFIDEKIEELYIFSSHFLNGYEYNKLVQGVMKYADKFRKLKISKPLLNSTEDLKKISEFLISIFDLKEYEALVLMGHGTEHHSNSVYGAIEKMIEDYTDNTIIIGTVEGYPEIDTVIRRLNKKNIKKVYLKPFMFVAGDHAKNDLAGEEESWVNILQKEGMEVIIDLKPLGEYNEIHNIYFEHLENII